MRFEFRRPSSGESALRGPHLLAHVEVILTEPAFAGLRIVGWAIWQRTEGVPRLSVGQWPPTMGNESDSSDCESSRRCSIAQDLKNAILTHFSKAFLGFTPEASIVPATGGIDTGMQG